MVLDGGVESIRLSVVETSVGSIASVAGKSRVLS